MSVRRKGWLAGIAAGALLLGGCATFQGRQPPQVTIAGIEPLQGEGLEMRMLVKLRVQNPNDEALNFDGMSVRMDVEGKRFASGVSDSRGVVPRFGETLIEVPVSITLFGIARQAMGVLTNEFRGNLDYEITGRLAGPAFKSLDFDAKGELRLPEEFFRQGQASPR